VIWDIDTRRSSAIFAISVRFAVVVSPTVRRRSSLCSKPSQLPSMAGQELASRVTCPKSYGWDKGSVEVAVSPWSEQMGESDAHAETRKHRVVAYDYGIKQNILRLLVDHQCEVYVVPAQTSAEDV